MSNAKNKNGGKAKRKSGVSRFKSGYNLPSSPKKLKGIVSRSKKSY